MRDLQMLARIREAGFKPSIVVIWMDAEREPWNWPPFSGDGDRMEYRSSVYLPEHTAITSLDLRPLKGLSVSLITRDQHSRVDALVARMREAGVDRVDVVRHWQDDPVIALEVLDGEHV